MKKNKLLLFIVVLLAAVVTITMYTRKSGTLKKELKDFAVLDTASVTKIFLTDKKGATSNTLLEKFAPGNWKVNGKYIARNDAVNMLLTTISKLEVRSPVAKSARNNVIKNLAADAVKIEIYQNHELAKTYYVGGPTQDQLGTFMLLENSNTPFSMHIPGFNGYLTPRYFTGETAWKERTVFKYKQNEIASVKTEHFKDSSASFLLTWKDENSFKITALYNPKTTAEPDTGKIRSYCSLFQDICYETTVQNMTQEKKDSILNSQPVYCITITDKQEKMQKATLFLKPVSETSLIREDREGNPLKFDVDRMYAVLNDEKELVIIQHFVFDKLLMNYFYFIQNSYPDRNTLRKK